MRIASGQRFALLQIDIDHFKAFNDYYGYARGDALIRFTAALLQEQVRQHGGEGDFVGHIGGDDFVIITVPPRARAIAEAVKADFDARVPEQYDPVDRERRQITVLSSRQGGWRDFDILSITILGVMNVGVEIQHSAQVSDRAKDLKKVGKAVKGSVIVFDRRSDGSLAVPAVPDPPADGSRGGAAP
jgi:GGDEF domain-containing protein